MSTDNNNNDDDNNNSDDISSTRLDQCVSLLKVHDIKVVVFDMDLTAVAQHSRGCLLRINLQDYLDNATPAFKALVPVLYENNFQIAIATHSDEAEFSGDIQPSGNSYDLGSIWRKLSNTWRKLSNSDIQPSTHILGHELATCLIENHFDSSICNAIKIVAYNPRVHPTDDPEVKEKNKIKRYHFRKIQEHFKIDQPQQILFFDDTLSVVTDCNKHIGIRAIQVNPDTGFVIQDLLSYFEKFE